MLVLRKRRFNNSMCTATDGLQPFLAQNGVAALISARRRTKGNRRDLLCERAVRDGAQSAFRIYRESRRHLRIAEIGVARRAICAAAPVRGHSLGWRCGC